MGLPSECKYDYKKINTVKHNMNTGLLTFIKLKGVKFRFLFGDLTRAILNQSKFEIIVSTII